MCKSLQTIRNEIGCLLGYAICDKCGNTLWATKSFINPKIGGWDYPDASRAVCQRCQNEWKQTREETV